MKNFIYNPLPWYAIPGYEGYYEINELGTVRSVDRCIHSKRGTMHFKRKYLRSRMNQVTLNIGFQKTVFKKISANTGYWR
jgi:hypothetical protein